MSREKAKAPLSERVREIILDAVRDKDQVDMAEVENAVAAIVESINRLKEASVPAPAVPGSEAALDALNAWFTARGHDVTGSTSDAWNFTAFEDAFIFSAGQGRRSNTLYMVRGLSVLQLSSAFGISLKDAYEALGDMPSTRPATDNPKVEPLPTRDCGTCRFCDPPPSDVTHFHRWAPRQCERPVPASTPEVNPG